MPLHTSHSLCEVCFYVRDNIYELGLASPAVADPAFSYERSIQSVDRNGIGSVQRVVKPEYCVADAQVGNPGIVERLFLLQAF